MKTRAALFIEPGRPMDVREVDIDAPRGDDVVVTMAAAGVCGSDLHVVRGEWLRPSPMILGHEGAGVVLDVGPAVRNVRPGDRVILSWAPSCQQCGSCMRGRPAACAGLRAAIAAGTLVDGTTRLTVEGATVYRMTTVGAFADHVLMPERAVIKLPAEVSLEQAALLGCAALTGVGAVENAAAVEPGSSALVVGAGGVGQFIVQGLRIAGASRIVAVDLAVDRRRQAVALGATDAVTPAELEELVASLPEGFDYAFDAVGSALTARAAFRALHNGGTAVLVGMGPPGGRLDVDLLEFVTGEKTLTGSIYGSADPAVMTQRLLAYLADGRLELSSMIGDRFTLDEINDAVAFGLRGEGGRGLVIGSEDAC